MDESGRNGAISVSAGDSAAVSAGPEPAGFLHRAGAYVIDWVLVWVLADIAYFVIVAQPGDFGSELEVEEYEKGRYLLIWILVMLCYTSVLEGTLWSATLGKIVLGLKVISRTENDLGLGRSILRNVLKLFVSQLVFGLGFLMVTWRDDKLAFHDLAPKTVVVLRRSTQGAELETSGVSAGQQSRLGIASFVISLVSIVAVVALLVTAGLMAERTPRGIDEESTAAIAIGLMMFVFLIASLVALGLGIRGLLRRDEWRIFAFLGTLFSAVTLIATIVIMLVGSAVG